jgi:uncharacterized protein YfeS
MWRLTYIDKEDRNSNFWSEYGSFCHKLLEEYFSGNLEIEDMTEYYEKNYSLNVLMLPPSFPKGMAEKYYQSGLDFFCNFGSYGVKRENYEVLGIEEGFTTSYDDILLIVKPDLILRNKKTNKVTLLDYKTSKFDEKKLDGYKNQLYVYAYFLWAEKHIEVDRIMVWFLRDQKLCEIENNPLEIQKALDWIKETRNKIAEETEWIPNLSKENEYFCSYICSVKNSCKYRNGSMS